MKDYIDDLFEDLRASQMADFSEIPQSDTAKEDNSQKEETIDDAMQSDYNSKSEVVLKKVLGVAITIAEALGWIHLDDNSAEGIASMADKTIGVLKTAYKVAKDPDRTREYIENLVEENAIRVTTFIENAIDAGKVIVPELISNWLIAMGIGNEVIRPIVQQVYFMLSDKMKKYIKVGSETLIKISKDFLITAIDDARNIYHAAKFLWRKGKQFVQNIL